MCNRYLFYFIIGCPNGSYADNKTRICVANCPNQPPTYADSSTNACV